MSSRWRASRALSDRRVASPTRRLFNHTSRICAGFYMDARFAIRPSSTQTLAEAVDICREKGVEIVPQGGNTSLTGADGSSTHLVISTGGSKKIREIGPIDMTITAEAELTMCLGSHRPVRCTEALSLTRCPNFVSQTPCPRYNVDAPQSNRNAANIRSGD
jgi:hypothetical protein